MILLLCLLVPHQADFDAHLKARTKALQANYLDGARTLDDWKAKLPRLRREYLDMLGLWPLPPRTPLVAKVTGTLKRDAVTIEKVHFQSRPGLYVTGNLYRPEKVEKKLPAVLYVCGHSGRGRDGNKTAFQDHGMWFARNGYVCLIIDTLQLGEVKGVHHGTYNLGRFWWHSTAYTPAGVEAWNGIRALDYLVSRPDVDADRLGVTGISGGGAVTIWIAAADERVKVAVPVSGMSDLHSYVANKVVNGHCDCMFLVNFRAWEWTTIAALIAPRPMLFANSDNDLIFPMDGNRRIIDRLRQVYRLYDKPDLVDDHVSKGGHDYRPDLRLAIFRWINRHLKKDTSAIEDAKDEPVAGKELRVFPTDDDLPKDSRNDRIDETFIRLARPRLPDTGAFDAWKRGLMGRLREGPFFGLPEKPGKPEVVQHRVVRGRGDVGTLVLVTDAAKEVPDWAKKHLTDGDVHLLRLRDSGPRKQPNYTERALALLGETADRVRVEDVIRAAHGGKWRVVGRGTGGVIGAYAALFEPGITEVVAIDPPASHREGPHFLGVMRIVDVPTALGLLAPRPLTLVGAKDRAFDHTAAAYRLAGAGEKLSLADARPRIDPAGIRGEVILTSADAPTPALERFAARAGKGKDVLLLAAGKETISGRLRAMGLNVEVRPFNATDDGSEPDLKTPAGVWVTGTESELRKRLPALARQLRAVPLLALSGPAAAFAGDGGIGVVPDAVVEATAGPSEPLLTALKATPGAVGYSIGPGSALSIQGRLIQRLGGDRLTLTLAEGGGRTERRITLTRAEDLTALRRAARDRAGRPFPAERPGVPRVEKGALVIIGGGGLPPGMDRRFVELAGGKKAKIVFLPTAVPTPGTSDRLAARFRALGAEVTILPGTTRAEVESEKYRKAFQEATGIWFNGGRQWRFVDAYEGTALLPLMQEVLERGGVIGGSSAGATIQGEYLCRGGVFHNFDIMYEGYERGLAFLPGTAIDQHFAQRKRFGDMTALMNRHPQLLGIGLDEATAIVVRGPVAEVTGRGEAHFYDRVYGKADRVSLRDGARYDLVERREVKR